MTKDRSSSPFTTAQQRKSRHQEKRDAVLLAAVQMFNERGFHQTSLDEVAASLGVTKPTIYHYLGNKDQVLLECVTLGLEQLLASGEAVRNGPGTGADRLRACLVRYAEIIMGDFGRCVIRTSEEELGEESRSQFRALKRRIDSAIRMLIQQGIDDGSIAPVDAKMLAFTLTGSLNWTARWHVPDGSLTPQQISQQMVDILAKGFITQT
ncbi:TetR family transcriptional regulator [Novosphingobium sp. AAP83]|uniref:TetR/AcrR family transcriptional regulator n=1 Tax=Novosphingobium sp. AAP83 TaxID=1523425 RepID=UPI0006B9A826|nr:TetR/AcrR family transcriptional regulator [Novosphingobium sp. AAP83]KPF91792.1 TetR family transcriptional regulator [Novosphingobium sp. AAP83]